MLKRLFIIALSVTCGLATGYASPTQGKVVVPVTRTSASDGKQMYISYCAPCHGADGRGRGPVASVLRTQPVDLTALARAHNGKYPGAHVISVLRFGSSLPAHGTQQMPVWGPILGKMNISDAQEQSLRIVNLNRYLESIQTK
jgi:mono/diheme cytochrome c family protein